MVKISGCCGVLSKNFLNGLSFLVVSMQATSNAYDEQCRKAAHLAATHLKIDFLKTHGTYCFVSGTFNERN